MPGVKKRRGGQTASNKLPVKLTKAEALEYIRGGYGFMNKPEEDWDDSERQFYENNIKGKEIEFAASDVLDSWTESSEEARHPQNTRDEIERKVIGALGDNTPYKGGPLFRGMSFDMTEEEGNQWLKYISGTGKWTEPGPASFSTSFKTARNFATHEGEPFRVIVSLPNATRGYDVEKGPLQRFNALQEQEVIQGTKAGARGWKITGTRKQKIGGETYHIIDIKE